MRRYILPGSGRSMHQDTMWSRSGRWWRCHILMSNSPGTQQLSPVSGEEIQTTLSAVFREEAGNVLGALLRILGNFAIAEEIVQDALLVALERWPIEGIPTQPGAWLLTVARRRAIDQLRRDARYREILAVLERPVVQEPDDRLRL